MIFRFSEMAMESKTGIRGGTGQGQSGAYFHSGEMPGVTTAGRTVLEPGASIGEHEHVDTADLYLILEGQGTGILDGKRFPVTQGDMFICRAGHRHGLINDSDAPLAFFGVLSLEKN